VRGDGKEKNGDATAKNFKTERGKRESRVEEKLRGLGGHWNHKLKKKWSVKQSRNRQFTKDHDGDTPTTQKELSFFIKMIVKTGPNQTDERKGCVYEQKSKSREITG